MKLVAPVLVSLSLLAAVQPAWAQDAASLLAETRKTALPVAEVCLTCHGPSDLLADDLKAALSKDYPLDRATGYAAGEVRGALTVTRPLLGP